MNRGKKAGIASGVIVKVGLVGLGGFVYKKCQDNIRGSQYGDAARLKHQAAIHPKLRQFIISITQFPKLRRSRLRIFINQRGLTTVVHHCLIPASGVRILENQWAKQPVKWV
ncbi:hypothetical protein EV1_013233 [Malus domestica]